MPDPPSPMPSTDSLIEEPFIRRTASCGTFVVVSALPGAGGAAAAAAYARVAEELAASGSRIVHERIFGSLSAETAIRAARRAALASRNVEADGPLTYVQGRPTWGEGLAGVILRAVAGPVRTIRDQDVACGRTWQTDGATFTVLQGIQGFSGTTGGDSSRVSQAQRTIERADRILRAQGGGYRDTVRTWFYLSDILDWYGPFNEVRNAAYRRFGLLPAADQPAMRLPASTGIRAEPPGGAACSLDLLAISSVGPQPVVQCVRNPRQQEAWRYGSAFSRCVVVRIGPESLIEISGTAAIDEEGQSLYPSDVRAQARCTIERLETLLEQAGATLHDVCAATVFVKRGPDAVAAREVLTEAGLKRFPAVWVEADVCRPELLFEIDAEAVIPGRDTRDVT